MLKLPNYLYFWSNSGCVCVYMCMHGHYHICVFAGRVLSARTVWVDDGGTSLSLSELPFCCCRHKHWARMSWTRCAPLSFKPWPLSGESGCILASSKWNALKKKDGKVTVSQSERLLLTIIIKKGISIVPIDCTQWEHRALYNNTHPRASDEGIDMAVIFFLEIIIIQVHLEGGFKRGGRVAECLRQRVHQSLQRHKNTLFSSHTHTRTRSRLYTHYQYMHYWVGRMKVKSK